MGIFIVVGCVVWNCVKKRREEKEVVKQVIRRGRCEYG